MWAVQNCSCLPEVSSVLWRSAGRLHYRSCECCGARGSQTLQEVAKGCGGLAVPVSAGMLFHVLSVCVLSLQAVKMAEDEDGGSRQPGSTPEWAA